LIIVLKGDTTLKKGFKFLLALIAVGAIIGLIIAYFCKTNGDWCDWEDDEFAEDEDFDLDEDLQPAGEREYVPLHKATEEASEELKTEA